MEENTNNNVTSGHNKKYYFLTGLVVILVIVGSGYYFWKKFNPTPYDQGMRLIENYEQLLREDTYGGKTPEETLKMFVEALKKEDVDLASKYFALDDNGRRKKWVARLTELKEKKLLQVMAGDIETKAKPTKPSYEGDAGFELLNDDGTVGVLIDMQLNEKSGVWKIESL